MAVIEVAVQEGNGDASDPGLREGPRNLGDLRNVHRATFTTVCVNARIDLADPLETDQPRRRRDRRAGVGRRQPRRFQQLAETTGDDQANRWQAPAQQRVERYRGAEQKVVRRQGAAAHLR